MSLTFALQALLARHENYMVEAETERTKMTARVSHFEIAKKEVEATSARVIDENRNLLDQLDDLNHTVSESDTHIQSLNATLQSTRIELQRLTVLAGRTAVLEEQVSAMETEQANLQRKLAMTQEAERAAVQRWKKAERTVGDLQDSIDRIEREAGEERERHVRVVARMEKRRAVEKELETSASHLNGAAAPTLERDKAGGSVVSHFVKDILQDNANLQLGIVELREMLTTSNEEVEDLRKRLLLHQPGLLENKNEGQRSALQTELAERVPMKDDLSELHVHHHYHAPTKTEVTRLPATIHRRTKKRRSLVASGTSTPLSGWRTPRRTSPATIRPAPSASATTTLSQSSVTIPPSLRNLPHRWSTQSSSVAPSTVPSSPQSMYRGSSMFDCIDNTFYSSRPTSPESTGFESSLFLGRHSRESSDISSRSVSTPAALGLDYATSLTVSSPHAIEERKMEDAERRLTELDLTSTGHPTIMEEIQLGFAGDTISSTVPSSAVSTNSICFPMEQSRLQIGQTVSSESLLSISGMDIHSLRGRPLQMLNGQGFHPRTPFNISSPTLAQPSSKPVISATTARGHPAYQRSVYDSSKYNRSLLSSLPAIADTERAVSKIVLVDKPTLGKRMGGWVWGKWGVTPTGSAGSLRAKAALAAIDERATGGTQPTVGRRALRTPSTVEATEVNTMLLKETLGE
ncbi:MAG: hypothetical protein LQ347_002283 [Umbilicaria vellea]|nr:MAG: hypothetical protein LQ347_002283 [Umbilicaria vellea]